MEKNLQDLAWACLPKEARQEMRNMIASESDNDAFDEGYDNALFDFFGQHNLTSDEDPEELLFISRQSVIDEYVEIFCNKAPYLDGSEALSCQACLNMLRSLFRDKCLPGEDFSDHSTQDKDNMEESKSGKEVDFQTKELNLCELLKGCEGETFYSRAYGELTLNEIVRDERKGLSEIKLYTPSPKSDRVWFFRNGKKHLNGEVDLWPSCTLYEKYPLDARKAWAEWAESRKPKRWRAKSSAGLAVSECEGHWEDYTYLYITSDGVIASEEEMGSKADTRRYNLGNYFRTREEARQVAEAVRECLMKFHEKNADK